MYALPVLPQELPPGLTGSVHEVVTGGLGETGSIMEEYHRLTKNLGKGENGSVLKRINSLQEKLETSQGWQTRQKVDRILTLLSLDPDAPFGTLSVGFRRRTLLARALVSEPEILLLDEPTNHLDIISIAWLEKFLQKYKGTVILVTHDRLLLRELATRIVEIDRGRVVSWTCGYRVFLERRQAALDNEETQRNQFKRKLANEEEWIRRGIKARRTRNEGRVRALMKMREAQQAWRSKAGSAKIRIHEAEASGKLVIEASDISYTCNGASLINDFSTKIIRGDRIGIIGPNGIGKTTLLRVLLGELAPDKGRVRTGTRIEKTYFDQLREKLDEDKTVQENVAGGKDMVVINGRQRHVIGYLGDFLFTPERARSPVRILSGGERNRLLLARLFTRPSNVLVLDEPTNDLDMETLELLEERILDYTGTILLVSHDREFLNNVVTSTLVFEDRGRITEYAGGYDDWLRQKPEPVEKDEPSSARPPVKQREKKDRPRKLTFKEGKELEALPGLIESLERGAEGIV